MMQRIQKIEWKLNYKMNKDKEIQKKSRAKTF